MNLSALASILLNIIAPIVLVAALGFGLGRTLQVEPRALSRVMLYIFGPALVFNSTFRSKLGGEFFTIAAFVVIITLLMAIVTLGIVKAMRFDQITASAFALSALFVNSGNYGIPLNQFAFGEEGLSRAVIFFAFSSMVIQTLAVFIAARGRTNAWQSFLSIFKLPMVYAFGIAFILNQANVGVPEPLLKSIELMANAAVPLMLVILGLELSRASLANDRLAIGVASATKLLLAPLVAFGLATAMGLQGLTRAVCVLQSSMPTAVLVTILAVEFRTKPEFVTGVVLVSTVASIVTLTLLLGILL